MNLKSKLSRGFLYTIFVLLSIWLVLILRSASLIWIYHTFMGFDHWEPFVWSIRNNFFIAFIQMIVILPGMIIFLRKQNFLNMRIAAISLLPLYILNLLIEPIGIWTMYHSWSVVITIGSVILFPLSVYLILFLSYTRYKSSVAGINPNFSA